MDSLLEIDGKQILDSLGDGVYVTDLDRKITYWNKAAERITGWKAEEILGHDCFDDILCHVDKDGHCMCGKEYCPCIDRLPAIAANAPCCSPKERMATDSDAIDGCPASQCNR